MREGGKGIYERGREGVYERGMKGGREEKDERGGE